MSTPPTIVVLHCPAGGGHRAAAEAVAEAAEHIGAHAPVLDALSLTPRWFANAYVQTHLKSSAHAKWAYGLGYRRLDRRRPITDRLRRHWDRRVGRNLLGAVCELGPDVVIATHFFPLSVLGAARLRGQLQVPLLGVVTDYAAHAFWAEPGVDRYCTATGGAALDLGRKGVPATHVAQTGIPVRRAFADIAPIALPGLTERLPVLLTSGGCGIGPLSQAVRSFAGQRDIELTVVCGSSERRAARARAAAQAAGVSAKVIGFERDMPARLREAALVVGKPGGLTTSEALACGRPMVLIGTCPGQERHNEQWLRINGAAIRARPEQVGERVAWLRRSGRLPAMAAAARRIGAPRAADSVLAEALGLVAHDRAA